MDRAACGTISTTWSSDGATGMTKPWWKLPLLYCVYLAASTSLILLILEGGLRLAGYPRGLYDYRPLDQSTLYLPNERIHQVAGPLPYEIVTNSLGYRGEEITREKPPGTTRIIALGDSVTEGFYVDNPDTIPAQLQEILRDRGHRVEVINVSQGYSSIDKELEMLRRWGLPLDPDIVLLTFVGNDLTELRNKTKEDILHSRAFEDYAGVQSEWFLFGRTAIGEILLDAMMRWRLRTYARNRDALIAGERPQVMPGGDDYQRNVDHFLRHLAKPADGVPLYTEFPPKMLTLLERYQWGLTALKRLCDEEGLPLVLSYHPDYSEIYRPDRPTPAREHVRRICADLSIPFHDQTPAFIESDEPVLHFAPVDYHPNAFGNRAVADSLAKFLAEGDFLPPALIR